MKTQILNYLKNNKKKVIILSVLVVLLIGSLATGYLLGVGSDTEFTLEHALLVFVFLILNELSDINDNLKKIANK